MGHLGAGPGAGAVAEWGRGLEWGLVGWVEGLCRVRAASWGWEVVVKGAGGGGLGGVGGGLWAGGGSDGGGL